MCTDGKRKNLPIFQIISRFNLGQKGWVGSAPIRRRGDLGYKLCNPCCTSILTFCPKRHPDMCQNDYFVQAEWFLSNHYNPESAAVTMATVPKPERRIQLAFDFDTPPQQSAGRVQLPPETLVKMGITPAEIGRFVQRVEQPIVVRTPGDAAIYLMKEIYTPVISRSMRRRLLKPLQGRNV